MNRKPRPLVPNDHESSPPGHFILTTKKKEKKSKRRQKREAEVEEDEDEDLNCRCCIFRRKFDNFSIFSARQNISTHVQNEKEIKLYSTVRLVIFLALREQVFFLYIFLYIYFWLLFFLLPPYFQRVFQQELIRVVGS